MFLRLIFLSTVAISVSSWGVLNWRTKQNVWERSGQFEGDIKLTEIQARNGILGNSYRWPNKIMPYAIAPHFSPNQKSVILKAVDEYNNKTCIRLRPHIHSTDKDYVYIKGNESGCWSFVGRIGGRQNLNLGKGCFSLGTIEHEMLHALGFYHQQSAPDRDEYVTIHWQNIRSGTESNFKKQDSEHATSFGVPYNYGSVMHYSAYAFSKNGGKTIEPKDLSATIGQRNGISERDIIKLKNMYEC